MFSDEKKDLLDFYDYITDATTEVIIKHNNKIEKKENSKLNKELGVTDSKFFKNYFANKKLKVNYKTEYKIDFLQVLQYCQECNIEDNLYKILYEILLNLDKDNTRTLYFMIKDKVRKNKK